MQDTKEKQPETSKKLTAHPYFPIVTLAGVGVIVAGIWFAGFSEGSRHAASKDNPFAASAGKQTGFSWDGASDWAKNFLSQNFPWAASSSWADRSAGSGVGAGDSRDTLGGLKPGDMPGDRDGRRSGYGQPSASYGRNEGGVPGYGAGSAAGGSGGADGRGGAYSASASARRTAGSDGRGGAHGRGLGAGDRTGLSGGGLFGAQRASQSGAASPDEDVAVSNKESAISDSKKKGREEEIKQRVAFKDEIHAVSDLIVEPRMKLREYLIVKTLYDLSAQQTLLAAYAVPRVHERAKRVSGAIGNDVAHLDKIASDFSLTLGHRKRLQSLSEDLQTKLNGLADLKRNADGSRDLVKNLTDRISKANVGDDLSKLRAESAKAHSRMADDFNEYAAKEKEFIELTKKYDKLSQGDQREITAESKQHQDEANKYNDNANTMMLMAGSQQSVAHAKGKAMEAAKAEADKAVADAKAINETHMPYHLRELATCGNNAGGCAYWRDWVNKDIAELRRLTQVGRDSQLKWERAQRDQNNAIATMKRLVEKRDIALKDRDGENEKVAVLENGVLTVTSKVSDLQSIASAFQITPDERQGLARKSKFIEREPIPMPKLGTAAAQAAAVLSIEAAIEKVSADYFTPNAPGDKTKDDTLKLSLADNKKMEALTLQAKEELAAAKKNFILAQEDEKLKRSDAINLTNASEELVKSFNSISKVMERLAELEEEAPARITVPEAPAPKNEPAAPAAPEKPRSWRR